MTSPSNILISDAGDVKLIDFSILKGDVAHAPWRDQEQARLHGARSADGDRDGRSDLFSVGVVLHDMLTARPLFADQNDLR